jgi:hypothetical protein
MVAPPYAARTGRPPNRLQEETSVAKKAAATNFPDNNANGMELDPLIDALLEHLPAPGDHWPKDQQDLWMQILALAFRLIYSEHPHESTAELNEPYSPQQQSR